MGTHPIFESDFDCLTEMKVKVKRGSEKKVYDASDLAELHELVTGQNEETVILSLNGTDPLPSVGTFASSDIVAMDILRVIEPSPVVTEAKTPASLDELIASFELEKINEQTYRYRFGGEILITQTPLGTTTLVNIIARGTNNETNVENIMLTTFDASMAELTAKLKKQIDQCRSWNGLRPAQGILSCPDEVLGRILSKLNAQSLLAIGQTCSKLRQQADNDKMWKELYVHDFTTLNAQDASWRSLYLKAKRERKLRDRQPRPSYSDPLLTHRSPGGYGHPLIPTGPPIIPGMIGGEYDLRPGGAFPGLRGTPPIRGDPPMAPGSLIDPDQQHHPHHPHGNDHHGLFNPDGSLSFNRHTRRNPRHDPFNPYGGGGGGFM